uniref:NB-ARC domain-containing protein n=1 Tax=Cannabis sativa TaxID=3483 RepID=A0A803PB25_CANSA
MDNAMQIVKQLQNSSVPEAEAEEEQRGNVGGEIIVVGRDHHLAQITEKLLKKDDDDVEDKNLMVIPIVGIGGVGKTIIAMLICDDQMVKSHFDLTIWVSLGVAFDVKAIMKQIISFITHNYPTISDFKELQALVFSEIRRKRFLLVLDDVPPNVDEHSWKVLTSEILSVGANGSRIIVTTRHTKVAEITGIKKLPDSISELKLLCNLDLSQNGDIKALPKSICGLYFLQTLKLNHCSNLQTLPRGITRLFNLRHLENKSCHCLTQVPRGLSQLSNLRTLSEFGLSKDNPSKPNGKLDELSCLNYLRGEIKIKNLRNPKDDKTAAANMKGKKEVLSLILIWDINSSVNEADCEEALEDLEPHPNLRELSISTYGGSKFSSWLPLLKNLVKLSISRCNRCHCLPRLDQLTNLQVLVVDELMKHHHQQQHAIEEKRALTSQLEVSSSSPSSTLTKSKSRRSPRRTKSLNMKPKSPSFKKVSRPKPVSSTVALDSTLKTPVPAPQNISSTTTVTPLSKLRTLHIIDMPNSDPNMWKSLHSLRSVTLDNVADINDYLKGGLRQQNFNQIMSPVKNTT